MKLFKKFTGISPFLVVFMLLRFKTSLFTSSSVTGLNSNISGTELFFEFATNEISITLVWFWRLINISCKSQRCGKRFNVFSDISKVFVRNFS